MTAWIPVTDRQPTKPGYYVCWCSLPCYSFVAKFDGGWQTPQRVAYWADSQ